MTLIVQKNTPILRKKAREVHLPDIGGKKLTDTLTRMREALAGESDGVAIAAPQIGVSLRVFIVWEPALSLSEDVLERRAKMERRRQDDRYLVFINPVITKRSREQALLEEGCLSVRWFYGKVRRAKRATIVAYDETGKRFTRGSSGILAQIFQHEADHLDGVLFIDKATDVQEILPQDTEHTSQSTDHETPNTKN
ncbi:MAG: peptide deformylase [Parcubacteria group bacterium Gr01-1014_72]|jgi:peptide deformylase|nr:MAG: peptide deformylase [Parcubacteria group bacterium Gr01-1014_72]